MKKSTHECAECGKVFIEPRHNSFGDAYWIGDKHFCCCLCAMKVSHPEDAARYLEIINGRN